MRVSSIPPEAESSFGRCNRLADHQQFRLLPVVRASQRQRAPIFGPPQVVIDWANEGGSL
jgi:hypothetical protein